MNPSGGEMSRRPLLDRALDRRSILCGGALLTAASLLGVSAPIQVAQAQAPSTQSKPNILFMLVDNLGYGELGCYGGGILRGPERDARVMRRTAPEHLGPSVTQERVALLLWLDQVIPVVAGVQQVHPVLEPEDVRIVDVGRPGLDQAHARI